MGSSARQRMDYCWRMTDKVKCPGERKETFLFDLKRGGIIESEPETPKGYRSLLLEVFCYQRAYFYVDALLPGQSGAEFV